MWQESGPERESRTQKCMSGLVWLGERERDEGFGFEAAGEAAAAAAAAVGGASNTGSKRFTHVFSREWAVPEGIAAAAGGRVSGGGGGVPGGGVGMSGAAAAGMGAAGAAVAAAVATAAPPGEDNGDGNSGTPAACVERPRWAKPLKDLSLSVGDMVCVSAQGRGRRRGARRGGGGLDHVRLLTGNIAAVFEDRVEVLSDRRLRVPRRGGRRGGSGAEAGEALDIEDLLGGEEEEEEERVLFRIDKDEWAAGIK